MLPEKESDCLMAFHIPFSPFYEKENHHKPAWSGRLGRLLELFLWDRKITSAQVPRIQDLYLAMSVLTQHDTYD
jgi:hypothetical protein